MKQVTDLSCLDANVLLEILLAGRPKRQAARMYMTSHSVAITPITAHLFVYFGLKAGHDLLFLTDIVSHLRILDCGSPEVAWAIANCEGSDFEDALQVASAVLGGCTKFATFDKQLAARYSKQLAVDLL